MGIINHLTIVDLGSQVQAFFIYTGFNKFDVYFLKEGDGDQNLVITGDNKEYITVIFNGKTYGFLNNPNEDPLLNGLFQKKGGKYQIIGGIYQSVFDNVFFNRAKLYVKDDTSEYIDYFNKIVVYFKGKGFSMLIETPIEKSKIKFDIQLITNGSFKKNFVYDDTFDIPLRDTQIINGNDILHIIPFGKTHDPRLIHLQTVKQSHGLPSDNNEWLTNICKYMLNLCKGEVCIYQSNEDFMGYMTLLHYPTHVEIYDVYTFKEFRGKKVATRMLEIVIQNSFQDYLWLGVLYNNPHFDVAVKTYLKMGFNNVYKTKETLGKTNLGNEFLGMIFDKTNREQGVDTKKYDQIVSQQQEIIKGEGCKDEYKIESNTLKTLYKLLDRTCETGGHLVRTDNKNELKIMDEDGFVYKGPEESFEVAFGNKTEFMFHTHPRICYEQYGCVLGWPSSADMVIGLIDYRIIRVNFVVTCEGIYSFQLTKPMQTLLYQLTEVFNELGIPYSDFITAISAFIGESFRNLEEFRSDETSFTKQVNEKIIYFEGELSRIQESDHVYKEVINDTLKKYRGCLEGLEGLINLSGDERKQSYQDLRLEFYMNYIKCFDISTLVKYFSDKTDLFVQFSEYKTSVSNVGTRNRINFERDFETFYSSIGRDQKLKDSIQKLAMEYIDHIVLEHITGDLNGKTPSYFVDKFKARFNTVNEEYILVLFDYVNRYVNIFIDGFKETALGMKGPIFDVQLIKWTENTLKLCSSCKPGTASSCTTPECQGQDTSETPKMRLKGRLRVKRECPSVQPICSQPDYTQIEPALVNETFRINKCLFMEQVDELNPILKRD